jgi:hypothetical protein
MFLFSFLPIFLLINCFIFFSLSYEYFFFKICFIEKILKCTVIILSCISFFYILIKHKNINKRVKFYTTGSLISLTFLLSCAFFMKIFLDVKHDNIMEVNIIKKLKDVSNDIQRYNGFLLNITDTYKKKTIEKIYYDRVSVLPITLEGFSVFKNSNREEVNDKIKDSNGNLDNIQETSNKETFITNEVNTFNILKPVFYITKKIKKISSSANDKIEYSILLLLIIIIFSLISLISSSDNICKTSLIIILHKTSFLIIFYIKKILLLFFIMSFFTNVLLCFLIKNIYLSLLIIFILEVIILSFIIFLRRYSKKK